MNTNFDFSSRWLAIVNPVAGKGRGLTEWPQISALLRESDISYDAYFTLHKYHATELTVQGVKAGYRRIIIVGGDGTIHETVNGLFLQTQIPTTDVLLSVIAVGTGNDWIRMFGIPRNYTDAIRSIKQGSTFLQDVGKATYFESRVPQTRYLANVGGVAYDAAVCRGFNLLKEKGYKGNFLYVRSSVAQAIKYKCQHAVIECDGEEVFADKLFTATIGICKYTGGGMSQTPYAVADDGLFDLTVIPKMNRIRLFTRYGTLYNDNIYNISGVSLFRAAKISIKSRREIFLEMDGEILGCSDFTFEVIPKAIRVIVSDKFLLE